MVSIAQLGMGLGQGHKPALYPVPGKKGKEVEWWPGWKVSGAVLTQAGLGCSFMGRFRRYSPIFVPTISADEWKMLPLWLWDVLGETFTLRACGRAQAVEDKEYLLKLPLLFPNQVPVGLNGPHPTCDFKLSPTCGTCYHFLK